MKDTAMIAKQTGMSGCTVIAVARAIGLSCPKGGKYEYTEEQAEKVTKICLKKKAGERVIIEPVAKEMTPANPAWWIDPLPKCLRDDYEEEYDD